MPAPEPSTENSVKDQVVAPKDDAEARATFARRPSVAGLRRARKTANFDTVGGAALLVGFSWPFVQAIASGTAGGLFTGLLGGTIFFFASAFASGIVEAAWNGARATSLAFLLISLAAGIYWWNTFPPWGVGVMGVAALVGLAITWRLETRRLRAGLELSEPIVEALLGLPEHLPPALQASVDEALAAHQQLQRSLTTLDDAAQRILIGRTVDSALAALIRQTRRQVELEHALEGSDPSPTLLALRDEGRARLQEIIHQIKALREALLTILVRHDADTTEALAERTEHLRLMSQALDELKREGA